MDITSGPDRGRTVTIDQDLGGLPPIEAGDAVRLFPAGGACGTATTLRAATLAVRHSRDEVEASGVRHGLGGHAHEARPRGPMVESVKVAPGPPG